MESEFKEQIKKLNGKELMTLKSDNDVRSKEIELEIYRRIRNE